MPCYAKEFSGQLPVFMKHPGYPALEKLGQAARR